MKISILCPNVSDNTFGRAWVLAKVLKRHCDVEVVGPVFTEGVWQPLAHDIDFELKTVKANSTGRVELRRMLNMVSGDLIYASKPLLASFGVALMKKFKTGIPVVLDIDDPELRLAKQAYQAANFNGRVKEFQTSLFNFYSYFYVYLMNKMVRFANSITVSGRVLQTEYGGTVLPHGRDVHWFDPKKFDRKELRRRYLPARYERSYVVSFIGTPRPHKGVEDLIEAAKLVENKKILFMLVGLDDSEYSLSLKETISASGLNGQVITFGQQPFEKLPEFLAITDLIVIPQRRSAYSHGQVPAKIFDAMAMQKPIIATNVSNLSDVLDGCGWSLPPQDPQLLAKAIEFAYKNPEIAETMAKHAREKCIRKYSWEAMEHSLASILEEVKPSN